MENNDTIAMMGEELLRELLPRSYNIMQDVVDWDGTKKELSFAKFKNFLSLVLNEFPEYEDFIKSVQDNSVILFRTRYKGIGYQSDIIDVINTILKWCKTEKERSSFKYKQGLFYTSDALLKETEELYKKKQYDEVMNKLNTALELALKGKLNIPLTKTGCKVANIIEILVKNNLGPVDHLKEAHKNILRLDNNGKHIAYISRQTDCITAIKTLKDLLEELQKTEIILSEDQRKKIYGE